MTIIIQKNQKFFDEVSKFNPKLAHLLEHEHGWTDKLVHRREDAGLSQSQGRREGNQKNGTYDTIKDVVPSKMGRN